MKGYSKVLVPLSGEETDEETTRLACEIAKKSKGKVYLLHIIEVKRSLPLDAGLERETRKGEEILSHAEDVADEQECEIETDLLQAREAGPAIVDEAAELGVDLIIMGMSYKKRFGEFSLSPIVFYVLKNAPCKVLIYRETALALETPKRPAPNVIERTKQE